MLVIQALVYIKFIKRSSPEIDVFKISKVTVIFEQIEN